VNQREVNTEGAHSAARVTSTATAIAFLLVPIIPAVLFAAFFTWAFVSYGSTKHILLNLHYVLGSFIAFSIPGYGSSLLVMTVLGGPAYLLGKRLGSYPMVVDVDRWVSRRGIGLARLELARTSGQARRRLGVRSNRRLFWLDILADLVVWAAALLVDAVVNCLRALCIASAPLR
jgi:hypothetical protein